MLDHPLGKAVCGKDHLGAPGGTGQGIAEHVGKGSDIPGVGIPVGAKEQAAGAPIEGTTHRRFVGVGRNLAPVWGEAQHIHVVGSIISDPIRRLLDRGTGMEHADMDLGIDPPPTQLLAQELRLTTRGAGEGRAAPDRPVAVQRSRDHMLWWDPAQDTFYERGT